MASELADRFFSELQRVHLKPLGFKKVRRTFVRERPTYTESFQFQGSAWNDPGRPWVFYINVGIQFHDLPRPRDSAFPHAHANDRIQNVIPGIAKEGHRISEQDYQSMLLEVSLQVQNASEALAPLVEKIYPRCKKEGYQWSFLGLAR